MRAIEEDLEGLAGLLRQSIFTDPDSPPAEAVSELDGIQDRLSALQVRIDHSLWLATGDADSFCQLVKGSSPYFTSKVMTAHLRVDLGQDDTTSCNCMKHAS